MYAASDLPQLLSPALPYQPSLSAYCFKLVLVLGLYRLEITND